MLKLYDFLTSGNCYKVHLLLAQLGIEYERIELPRDGGTTSPEFRAINPLGKVPVLAIGPGRRIDESAAILFYLAHGTRFLPDDAFARAEIVKWIIFEQRSVLPTLAVARYLVSMAGKPPGERATLERAQKGGGEALAHLDRHLGGRDWAVGDSYSIADTALYAYCHLAEVGEVPLAPYDGVCAWLARVEAVPGYVTLGNPQP